MGDYRTDGTRPAACVVPTNNALARAIGKRERHCREMLDLLREADESGDVPPDAYHSIREAIELIGCLRRLVADRTVDEIHRAFGAPGDFGYDTPIGEALNDLYRAATEVRA